jgi:hypothetical protein
MLKPVKDPVTQKFGEDPDYYARYGLAGHNGIDFGCWIGTPVRAGVKGKVTTVGYNSSDGKCVAITTPDGYVWWYLHNSEIKVNEGDHVFPDTIISLSGDTGGAIGAHLHHQVFPPNRDVDNGFRGAVDPSQFYEEDTDMVLSTAKEVNQIWAANGVNRGPTEEEVQEALGRKLEDYMDYFLELPFVKENLAKVKYYDTDVATADKNGKSAKRLAELKKLLEES